MKLRSIFLGMAAVAAMAAAAQAKYVFYFIGDGMGPGQVMSTEAYNRLVLGEAEKPLMMTLPVNSFVTTYSASHPVTDSAAAGTALSTGSKTKNNMLGMAADTTAVTSVAQKLHDDGYGVAIITTVSADDATPGAFYAHVPSRKMYYEIGRQAADSGYELIAGAALRGTVDGDGNPNDLLDYIKASGVEIVGTADELRNTDSRRAIYLPDTAVWPWNAGYAVDEIEGSPSIADMTVAGIEHLKRHTPDRFFMMIEGGNIDHASHANDGGAVIKEMLRFNDAIAHALKFYQENPDETLIVITADHETGGMSLGNNITKYNANLQYFASQKISKERFSKLCDSIIDSGRDIQWPEMKEMLTEKLGLYSVVEVNDETDARLQEAFRRSFLDKDAERQSTLYADINAFPVEVFKVLNDAAGIGWTTLGHSGSFVPLFAIGEGAELFIGQNDNTDVPKKIYKATRPESEW